MTPDSGGTVELEKAKLRVAARLSSDFSFYAQHCLKIRTKTKGIQPLILNRVQQHIHQKIEKQLAETGKVRAIILKARQPGCSTYVEGRYYWKVTHKAGQRAFILTHEQDATDNIFEMANRYHEHCPPEMRPETGAANAKELKFSRLDSGYRVAQTVATDTGGAGRSQTNQFFHGSEVALWKNAKDQGASALQTVPDEPGTEIILESTARGFGNYFHRLWSDAERGLSSFIAVFIPWFWVDEYRLPVPPSFSLSTEDLEYQAAYKLDLEQMAWRANKIRDLGDEILFRQEYPAIAAEAFQTTNHDNFIPAELVSRARRATHEESGPLIIGADPARGGGSSKPTQDDDDNERMAGDRFSLAWRRGRKVRKVESRKIQTVPEGAGWIKQVIDEDKPDRVFIDVGGVGAGTYDMLVGWGEPYSKICRAVNFGGKPLEPSKARDAKGKPMGGPLNRRAEMWLKSRDWLEDVGGADIPDRDTLQTDACTPGFTYDTYNHLVLESKQKIKARGGASPDEWDAVALTFAEPVAVKFKRASPTPPPPRDVLSGSGGSSYLWLGN